MSSGFLNRYDTNRGVGGGGGGLYSHKRWPVAETVRFLGSRKNVPTVEQK